MIYVLPFGVIKNSNNTKKKKKKKFGGFRPIAGADPGIKQRGTGWRAREREPITGVWGRAPSGVQGHIPWSGGQGAKPPEAEKLLVFLPQRRTNI